jgi:CRISPR-associated protein Csy1
LEAWLEKASRQAKSRAFSTHPSTFMHPGTGIGEKNLKEFTYVTPIIYLGERNNDGYLRSGNVHCTSDLDSLGDASALGVDAFLRLKLSDGKTVLEHIQEDTETAKGLLGNSDISYESLRESILTIIKSDSINQTSTLLKQVYFPVGNDYHLLSLLVNSGILFELKIRIDGIRFSEENIALRADRRKNLHSDKGYVELHNLSVIEYGGANKQNISVLNVRNRGSSYLLPSLPPEIHERSIQFPRKDFFIDTIRSYQFRDIFEALHRLFKTDYNNMRIRDGRDYYVQDIVDRIIQKMWAVRAVSNEQYRSESSFLKKNQLIWLCNEFLEERETGETWLNEVCDQISLWIIHAYEKTLGTRAIKLGEAERKYVDELVRMNKEALR